MKIEICQDELTEAVRDCLAKKGITSEPATFTYWSESEDPSVEIGVSVQVEFEDGEPDIK